jgi:hypothetical protein
MVRKAAFQRLSDVSAKAAGWQRPPERRPRQHGGWRTPADDLQMFHIHIRFF